MAACSSRVADQTQHEARFLSSLAAQDVERLRLVELHRLLECRRADLLREHRHHARRGRHAFHPDDRPARTPPSTPTLLAQATRAGAHIGPLCAAIHRREGEAGVRRILGVLSLVKQHGPTVVDTACAAALELAVADYRFVRRYVERHPAPPLTLRQVDPLIRELTHYRDVIAQKSQEEIPR